MVQDMGNPEFYARGGVNGTDADVWLLRMNYLQARMPSDAGLADR